jgi:hypothetical protein
MRQFLQQFTLLHNVNLNSSLGAVDSSNKQATKANTSQEEEKSSFFLAELNVPECNICVVSF